MAETSPTSPEHADEHSSRDPDGWPDDEYPSHLIRLSVHCADGKRRGGFFKDDFSNPHRWSGAARQGVQEVMVCSGDLATGSWYLIEYVIPRQISGERSRDSLKDEASKCCNRTAVQALYWFSQQAIGPPPALVERVRDFAARWRAFCASSSASSLLQTLINGHLTDDDPHLCGQGRSDLEILVDLNLAVASWSPLAFSADSIVQDMKVDGYIAWMNGHLLRVATLLDPPTAAPPTNQDSALVSPSPSIDVPALLRDGKTWKIRFQGKEASLPNRVGLEYLQKLVAAPGRPVDVHDLKGATRIMTSHQSTLDEPARTALKKQLVDLEDQLATAEKLGDEGGAHHARAEIQRIVATVGNPKSMASNRSLPSESERVRSSVAQAIKTALAEIGNIHPEAHSHLVESLVAPTGSTPSYQPRSRTVWLVNPTGASFNGSMNADGQAS